MRYKDHEPYAIDNFMGLYRRGSASTCPPDHFTDCQNIRFTTGGDVTVRPGIDISQDVIAPITNVKRVYNYPTSDGNTLIVLGYDYDTGDGTIYHVVDSATVYSVLTVQGMTDFAFVPYAGRAYLSPFTTYVIGGLNVEKGIQNEVVYVYLGDGSTARAAAGDGISGALTIANGAAGNTDAGFHLFGIVCETNSGYLTPPGALTGFTTLGNFSVSIGNIPTSGDPSVTRRHVVATKVITGYNGDTEGYQYFFIPGATIEDNTTTFLNNISFFDADLLDDATHLFENYTEIPAGAAMCLYHDRLCVFTTYDDISIGLVSAVGEPEAIDQITGIITVPPDSNPITNGQELRDVLYVFKRSRTVSFADNGDDPVTWPLVIVDTSLGCPVHGIATVLDSGSSSIDYLIITTYAGVTIFNGRYIVPELSWKVEDLWVEQDRNEFRHIQIINAPIQKEIYIVLPDTTLLVGNYSLGMNPKSMKWSYDVYVTGVNTVAIREIDEIVLGADLL